jgi:CheY-like chemotaxis protein
MPATPRLLVIDDSPTVRKLLQLSLSEFEIEPAGGGREGLDKARARRPDLVLLDYILPDMKGYEVCAALEADPATRNIPVIVLSGKSAEDLQQVFRDRPSVARIITKPFSGPVIAAAIRQALAAAAANAAGEQAPPAPAPAPSERSGFSPAQRRAVAQALFNRLRERLNRIPEWLPSMGAENPAVFFAKRLITEEVVDRLMGDLAAALGAPPGSDPSARGALQGNVEFLPPAEILRIVGASGRTGVLSLAAPDHELLIFVRRGEVIFASATAPDESVRAAVGGLDPALRDSLERAEGEQKRTGKPVYVSLAESGRIPAGDLPELLAEQARRVLCQAVVPAPRPFRWRDLPALPPYVEAYGRPFRLENLELERLREADDRMQVEPFIDSMELVFRRNPDFSARIRGLEFTDTERRVLTLVGGRTTVRKIADVGGVPPYEVFRILYRMTRLGLISKDVRPGTPGAGGAGHGPAGASGAGASGTTSVPGFAFAAPMGTSQSGAVRPVAVLEPDLAGVVEPLGHFLRRMGVPMVTLDAGAPVLDRFLAERPRLALLDAGTLGGELETLARQVRSSLEISDMALAATCPDDRPERVAALRQAGFDAVLVKPFFLRDLESLLAV